MKVCIITSQYPPIFNGGVAGVTRRIAENITKLGVKVHIVAPGTKDLDEIIKPSNELGITVHRTFPGLGNPLGDYRQLREVGDYIIRLHEKEDFDLLHAMFLIPTGLIGSLVAGEIEKPVILSIHGSDIELFRYNPTFIGTLRFVLENSSFVTSVNSDLLDKAKRISNIRESQVVYNAFDCKEVDLGPHEENTKNQRWRHRLLVKAVNQTKSIGAPIIGTAGFFRPIKGIPILLDAFKSLVDHYPKALLLLIGDFFDPDGKKAVLDQINGLGLKRKALIVGIVPPHAVIDWMRELDIFALPSRYEGSPGALLEAMACGLPVVATNVGGIPDIITDDLNGLLIPSGTRDVLAEKLITLAGDVELRKRLGGKAKHTIKTRFSSDQEAQTWIKIYDLTLGNSFQKNSKIS